jgi:ATP phosphoribosyltransferase
MTETVRVAVPRKGRPLEAVLERFAAVAGVDGLADDVSSTLRYEKAITKGTATPERDVYERLAAYSDLSDPTQPEYTLLRDDREGKPRRIVFDSVTVHVDGAGPRSAGGRPSTDDGVTVELIGREEPFRALRTHEFGLGFDSADLVLEEVVTLGETGVESIADVNARIDPRETDVRVVSGLGDTVYHTLLATPEILPPGADLDRSFVADYEGPLCISPRYERLVRAVLGTHALDGVEFVYPDPAVEEEAAIAGAGLGVYLTMTGSTARNHGLVVGDDLFPSETVLMENAAEAGAAAERLQAALTGADLETAIGPS